MEKKLRLSRGIIPKGVKHNNWTALGETRIKPTHRSHYKISLFRCDCGMEAWHKDSNIYSGRTNSCYECYREKLDNISQHLTPEQLERKKYVDRLWPNK